MTREKYDSMPLFFSEPFTGTLISRIISPVFIVSMV